MTREEAIYCMKSYIDDPNHEHCTSCPYYGANQISENVFVCNSGEAHKMAVEALKHEPCTDAISREELLKAIDTWDKFGYTETGCFVREPKGDYVPYIHYDDVINCIKGMSPVTPAEKVGQWITQRNVVHQKEYYYCSECREEFS